MFCRINNILVKVVRLYRRDGLYGASVQVFSYVCLCVGDALQSFRRNGTAPHYRSKDVTRHQHSVDIVVCVHNALIDVMRCLDSLFRNTYPPFHLIIVDDGSGPETQAYLERIVVGQPALLIRNDEAVGYTKAANSGLRLSRADFVVLLNSDTIVPMFWLDRLVECANSSDQIGMVGPLSNTASWQSVPLVTDLNGDWAQNPLPDGWSVDDYANEVARVSQRIYPRVGFLNGFCLLIKRRLIADVGVFDDNTFARGYGEENDFALRATHRNWRLVIADDCYVYHSQSKSYSHERRLELAKLAGAALERKHGPFRIRSNLELTQYHPALLYVRRRCADIEAEVSLRSDALRRFGAKRVLFLLPAVSSGGGGNVVLLEAAFMREFGVDAWVANLERNRVSFEQNHPGISVPLVYLKSPEDLAGVASDFDAVVATLYLTVFWMEAIRSIDNAKVLGYYVQDFEPDFFDEGDIERDRAVASYSAISNMCVFTKTEWNRQALNERLGVAATVIGSSVDLDKFHPSSLPSCRRPIVKILAMVRPSTPRRAPEATMRVLQSLAQRFGKRVEITIFGTNANARLLADKRARSFKFRNLGEVDSSTIARELADSDIFIDCSVFQAMGLTAMEAMASGVAVVGPINGGLREIIVDGQNGLLVDTQNESDIVSAASRLISDDTLRSRIRANALSVLRHSPVVSTFNILDVLFPITTVDVQSNVQVRSE